MLDKSGTSFQTLQLEVRHDLMLADLLRVPEQPASREWSALFGYASPGALGRTLWKRYDVGVADVRRIGTVGAWLDLARRQPRTATGNGRAREAEARIEAFRRAVRNPGPEARTALDTLGRGCPPTQGAARRPRYPAIGRVEVSRLDRVHR